MAADYPAFTSSSNTDRSGGCMGVWTLIFVEMWVASVIAGHLLTGLTTSTLLDQSSDRWSFYMALIRVVLLALPLLPLAFFYRRPLARAIYRTWLMGVVFSVLVAPAFLTPPYASQLHGLLHILFSLFYSLVAWLFAKAPRRRSAGSLPRSEPRTLWTVLAAAAAFSLPWLAWGAFGSPVDILLHTLAALSLGLAVGVTLELYLFPTLLDGPVPLRPAWRFALTGFAASVTVAIFTSALGFGYYLMQFLLLAGLPWMGFVVAGMFQPHPAPGETPVPSEAPAKQPQGLHPERLIASTLLVGLAAAAPMTLIDAPELYLVAGLSPGEIWYWALAAAGVSFLIGVLFAFLSLAAVLLPGPGGVFSPAGGEHRPTPLWVAAAGLAVLAGAFVYFVFGQPGFHGDHLFVILKDQAVVPSAALGTDPVENRQAVYALLTRHALRTQAPLRAELDRFGIRYNPYYLVNAIEVSGGPLLRMWLTRRPEVDRVIDNPWLRPLPGELPPAERAEQPVSPNPWNLQMLEVQRAWREFGVDGSGIVIGQSDSGVQWDHPALVEKYRGYNAANGAADHNLNWFDPWFGSRTPGDISGHGTHTLGTVLGDQVGVAPGATWFACANLPRDLANPALYLDCWQFMLAPFPLGGDPFSEGVPELGANVINNSWGCPAIEGCDPASLQPAVQALRAAGIFVVASAGNEGPSCSSVASPPAIYGEVFSVGAIDRRGELVYFSSLGPVTVDGSGRIKPDIVAPGENVISSLPGSSYGPLSGTSMAGPHAAGVVALMWSANPALTGNIPETERILRASAGAYTGTLPDCSGAVDNPSSATGYGVLNAYEAVRMALEATQP